MSHIERIASGFGLLEGPLYDPGLGFVVADAEKGGIWAFSTEAPPKLLVQNRRGIGGMALHVDGAFVVSGRNVALKLADASGPARPALTLLNNDPAGGVFGFNDLTVDPAGRIYAGSLGFHAMNVGKDEPAEGKPTGSLHMIDIDGSARKVADDVVLTNGLGFSSDGKKLYWADSLRHCIYLFDVDPEGALHDRRTFVTIPEALPDGLAVDVEGNVWVALCHGGAVAGFSDSGKEIERIGIEVPMVTSLCFGGPDWRDLYIVTGSTGAAPELGAGVYRIRQPVPGSERPKARTKISQAGLHHSA
jgi:xylono-1,5-lactonase